MNLNQMRNHPYRSLNGYAVPSVIGMLLTSLITIVDGAFISRNIGDQGLAAVNLGIPMLYLFLGITIMLGVGGSTQAVNRLGSGKKGEANNSFMMTVTTVLAASFLLAVIFRLTLPVILNKFNLPGDIQSYLLQYYSLILFFYPIMMLNTTLGMFIRGEGRPQVFMLVAFLSNILNVYLDYLLIYKLSQGMAGAAAASGIAVSAGLLANLLYFFSKRSTFTFKKAVFSRKDLKQICYNGSSEMVGQLSMSITTALFNIVILNIIGVLGVAAITIIGYLGYIHNMIVTGIGQGMSPIISFCHGAEDYELIQVIRNYTQKIVFGLGILFTLFILTGRHLYIGLFTVDQSLQTLVSTGMLIFAVAFLINGYNMVASFYFTSIGAARESVVISGLRGLFLLSFSIIVLPVIFKDLGIWLAVPFTELITFLVALRLVRENRQLNLQPQTT